MVADNTGADWDRPVGGRGSIRPTVTTDSPTSVARRGANVLLAPDPSTRRRPSAALTGNLRRRRRALRGNGAPVPTPRDPSAPDPRDRDPSRDALDDLRDT